MGMIYFRVLLLIRKLVGTYIGLVFRAISICFTTPHETYTLTEEM